MTIVFPVLLYAAETWSVNKEEEKRLLAFEIRCYDLRRTSILAVKYGKLEELMKRYEQLYNEKKQWWIQSE